MGDTTGVTSVAGTTYPSGAHEFNPGFIGVRVARSLVLCVVFGSYKFVFPSVPFLFIIVLSVLL